jgi:UDP-GlcNAc:undecaprenyl-phosphate/decaprenyl-phosphate GlcNAc-1-phosphate transferase
MRTATVAFVASTVTAGLLTPAIRRAAYRWGFLDHALTSRKIHGKPIPRLGGIAIVLAFYTPLVALFFVNSEVGGRFLAQPTRAFALFAGGLAIAGLGVWDDLKGANAKTKFLVQFAVAGAMYALGYRIDEIANPFGPPIQLGYLALPFTLLWITGVINAVNLIDGLDGLAGGVSFIAVATTFAIAGLRGEPLMVLFTAALAGAALGFLFYNFNPATIFMGDTGSMFLGFVLATTAIQTNQNASAPAAVAILVPVIALGLPIGDTLLAMARRAARGAPLFSADRGHIHHRLLDLGLGHRQTVLVLYGASIVLGLSAVALTYASSSQALYFLIALSGVAYVALRHLGYIKIGNPQQALADRKRNVARRAVIRRIGEGLRDADTVADVWAAVRRAAVILGASGVALHLPEDAEGEEELACGLEDPDQFRARYSVLPERPGDTHLELGWSDGRRAVGRDTEIAIELLCDHVSSALERIADEGPALSVRNVIGLRT